MVFLVVLKSPIANQYGVKMSETKFIKAGIVIDSWKKKIFEKNLTDEGYSFESFNGPGLKLVTLTVETDNPMKLGRLVVKMQQEAANSKLN